MSQSIKRMSVRLRQSITGKGNQVGNNEESSDDAGGLRNGIVAHKDQIEAEGYSSAQIELMKDVRDQQNKAEIDDNYSTVNEQQVTSHGAAKKKHEKEERRAKAPPLGGASGTQPDDLMNDNEHDTLGDDIYKS